MHWLWMERINLSLLFYICNNFALSQWQVVFLTQPQTQNSIKNLKNSYFFPFSFVFVKTMCYMWNLHCKLAFPTVRMLPLFGISEQIFCFQYILFLMLPFLPQTWECRMLDVVEMLKILLDFFTFSENEQFSQPCFRIAMSTKYN